MKRLALTWLVIVAAGPLQGADGAGRLLQQRTPAATAMRGSDNGVAPVSQPASAPTQAATEEEQAARSRLLAPDAYGVPVVASDSVMATAIRVVGNTVLPVSDVEAITAPFTRRPLTTEDLDTLREQLSAAYVARGYVNSGVIVPDQSLAAGVLELQAIEGHLDSIEVTAERLSDSYVADRLTPHLTAPFDIDELRAAIGLLQRDPRIARIDARVLPGNEPGAARLRVDVEEAPQAVFVAAVDNHRSESIGAERGTLTFGHDNLSGAGDVARVSVAMSAGSDAAAVSYMRPYAGGRFAASVHASRNDARVIEAPFEELDVESLTDTVGLALTARLAESLTRDVEVVAGAEYRQGRTRLLGDPFSFAPGAVDGKTDVRALYLGADWIERGELQAVAVRLTVRHGLDCCGVRRDDVGAVAIDAEFTSVLAQFEYLRDLGASVRFVARGTGQLAAGALPSLEKLAIGGINTVRGYRENLLVRDEGAALAFDVEWTPAAGQRPAWLRALTLRAFVDAGWSADETDVAQTSLTRDTARMRRIVGAGVGVRWQPLPALDVDAHLGFDIDDDFAGDDPRTGVRGDGLQDDGLHFAITYARRL